MNVLNMLEAMGYGAAWLSSEALRDPLVKTALGFAETNALLGWLYVGTPDPARPGPGAFSGTWRPAPSRSEGALP